MKEQKFSIYQLRCPIDNTVKYVGSSADLNQRYLGHIQSPTKCLKDWIAALIVNGKHPIMDELESGLVRRVVSDRERFWAVKLQKKYGTLLNVRYLKNKSIDLPPINYLKPKESI